MLNLIHLISFFCSFSCSYGNFHFGASPVKLVTEYRIPNALVFPLCLVFLYIRDVVPILDLYLFLVITDKKHQKFKNCFFKIFFLFKNCSKILDLYFLYISYFSPILVMLLIAGNLFFIFLQIFIFSTCRTMWQDIQLLTWHILRFFGDDMHRFSCSFC